MVTVFSNAAVFDGTRFIPGRRDVVVDGSQITAITEAGFGGKPLKRVVGADTYTPLAGAAFLVIPKDEDIVAAAQALK